MKRTGIEPVTPCLLAEILAEPRPEAAAGACTRLLALQATLVVKAPQSNTYRIRSSYQGVGAQIC